MYSDPTHPGVGLEALAYPGNLDIHRIDLQEEIGLDVIVHGEPERNDMVQYFAENLLGANCMHRARCRSARRLRRPERQLNYLGGVCVARAVARLDHDLAVIGEYADRCIRCKPGSDSEGVELLAGYLRRIRGQEPTLRPGLGLVPSTSE